MERPPTPLDACQVGMLWQLARRYAGRPFFDPFKDPVPAPQAPPQPNTGTAAVTTTRKLKTRVYTEQGDDTEVLPAMLDEVALGFKIYHDVMEEEPPAEGSPAADQLAVLNAKVKSEGVLEADFARWTPGTSKFRGPGRSEHGYPRRMASS